MQVRSSMASWLQLIGIELRTQRGKKDDFDKKSWKRGFFACARLHCGEAPNAPIVMLARDTKNSPSLLFQVEDCGTGKPGATAWIRQKNQRWKANEFHWKAERHHSPSQSWDRYECRWKIPLICLFTEKRRKLVKIAPFDDDTMKMITAHHYESCVKNYSPCIYFICTFIAPRQRVFLSLLLSLSASQSFKLASLIPPKLACTLKFIRWIKSCLVHFFFSLSFSSLFLLSSFCTLSITLPCIWGCISLSFFFTIYTSSDTRDSE